MAHWTQQITEAYRALQEAELVQLNESAVQGLKKVIQNAHADKANLSVAGAQVAASATKALRNMGNISHGDENHHFGDDLKPFELSEQTEYISSLENAVVALAESMNMSVEDLLNEGEMRNIRLQKALQKAGDNVRIGNTKLAAMDSHVRDVATTQGGSAGQAADNALSRQKGKTKVAVSQAIEKSTKLRSALDTSTNQVRNSRAARVARGYFSDSPNQQRQASRISSIGNERNNPQASNNTTGNTSSDSLAAQGKLPSKKFGSPVNQRMSLSATRSDSKFARSNQAQAQSDAAKARNQANKPV